MNQAQASKLTEHLLKKVELGPGEKPVVLGECQRILSQLRLGATSDYTRTLIDGDLKPNIERWFSATRWQGKDGGTSCQTHIYGDTARLDNAWNLKARQSD